MNYESFVEECIKRWNAEDSEDERILFYRNYFEQWINQLPKEFHHEVLVLMKEFSYYTRRNVNYYLCDLHRELEESIDVSKKIIYSFIKSKDGLSNSSNDYWHEYKSINNLKQNFYVDLKSVTIKWDKIENIIFIDDFSGSGQSFYEELEKHKEKLYGKQVIFVTICIMEEAILNIKRFCKENNIKIMFLSSTCKDKAFNQEYFQNNETARSNIIKMSECLGIEDYHNDNILGWGDSEALVAFYNNTPNNTIKFLRKELSTYFSIFPRGDKKSTVRPNVNALKVKKKERLKNNYNKIVRR